MANERNPLFVPKLEPKTLVCPKCEKADYTGRNVQGVIHRTCRLCGHKWEGGLPQLPQDPRIPMIPERYVPPVMFEKSLDARNPNPIEVRRRVDATPEFRKGAPIPDRDE